MNIIQFIHSLGSGGAEKFVVNLSNQLAKEGHDVTICILLNDSNPNWIFNKQFINPNIKFHSMKFSKGFSLKKVTKVCKYIKSQSPDVVHCHLNVIPYIFPLAILKNKIKFIHTIHNVAEKASGLKIQRNINRYFYKSGHITPITISKECKLSFESFYNLHDIACIDNGCPAIKASNRYSSVRQEINQYKKDDQTKVFVHVARFHPQKNQKLLVEAFNELFSKGFDFTLLIIGNYFDSTEEGKALQSHACQNIHFLGEKSNVGDYLLCADAFCLSSIYEGLPISLIEALSCGITPICTAVGGIPDVITDKITGYLSGCTQSEYIKALEQFYTKPLEKDFLKEHFKKHFSIEECTKQYLHQYNEN